MGRPAKRYFFCPVCGNTASEPVGQITSGFSCNMHSGSTDKLTKMVDLGVGFKAKKIQDQLTEGWGQLIALGEKNGKA